LFRKETRGKGRDDIQRKLDEFIAESRNNREYIITDLGSTGIVGLAFSTFKRNGSGYLIFLSMGDTFLNLLVTNRYRNKVTPVGLLTSK
jgi:hypothetical protein